MKFSDIPQYTGQGTYRTNISWTYIEDWINRQSKQNLELNPDFQRGHVWTEAQQIAYVEFSLRGGKGSQELKFNCIGWLDDYRGPFVLVDGKQRLTAVLKFINNDLPAFGTYYKDFVGVLKDCYEFIVCVNNLHTRKEVLQWYLELNSGGVVHTEEELKRVQKLLELE
jgi:hypothetical protein